MKFDFFHRLRHRDAETKAVTGEPAAEQPTVVQIDASSLSRVFSAPIWVRDLGLMAWFLVGAAVLVVGLTWLLALTSTITIPVAVGAILATVAGPLVSKMHRRGIHRAIGAALVLLGFLALGVLIFLLVVGGLSEQSSEIKASLNQAVDTIQSWAKDAGVDSPSTTDDATSGTSTTGKTLLEGVVNGIQGLTSLVFFLTFSAFATFFLLKDGPVVRRFVDRHLGVPASVATVITGNVIQSLRRYFLGVTIVATFNAIVVGLAAVLLDVPLAGTIAVVVFVTAYIPFIGAFVSGAFAVLLTLSSQGTTAAADHARRRHPRERPAAEHRAADRIRSHARPEPARGPHRDDRLRQPLRHDRHDPRRSAHVCGDPHQQGARGGEGRRGRRRRSRRRAGAATRARAGPALEGDVHRLRGKPDRRPDEEDVAEGEQRDADVARGHPGAERGEEEGDSEQDDGEGCSCRSGRCCARRCG